MKDVWMGILWTNRQWSTFHFEDDGYDLLIMYVEFLITKKTDSSSSLLKCSPILYNDKVWICGSKSCLSRNRRKSKILVDLEVTGKPETIEIIKGIQGNSASILELEEDEKFRAHFQFTCKEMKFWGGSINYVLEIWSISLAKRFIIWETCIVLYLSISF